MPSAMPGEHSAETSNASFVIHQLQVYPNECALLELIKWYNVNIKQRFPEMARSIKGPNWVFCRLRGTSV